MIRPTLPGDFLVLEALVRETGFFKPAELVALGEVFRDYPLEAQRANHHCVTFEAEGRCLGFAYFAPSSMADRAWYLYWIAVERSAQGRGIGRALMKHVEDAVREDLDGRLFLIETSSQPLYEPTRRFYLGLDFAIASRLADFYADGDDLIIFAKRLIPKAGPPSAEAAR